MPFSWDDIPYTNFHELNLDYFINKFKQIFDEWADLYDTLTTWKNTTTTELETWKTQTENNIISWENSVISDLNTWKSTTETNISSWETATLNALDAWKTATTAIFEAIRVEAAGSATAAENSATAAGTAQTAAETAKTAAETAQAAAEAAAASVSASAAQITTNTNDISELKTQINIEYSNVISGNINRTTGTDGTDNKYLKTDYIHIDSFGKMITSGISNICWIAYNNNKEFIQSSGWIVAAQTLTNAQCKTAVPSVEYIRFLMQAKDSSVLDPDDYSNMGIDIYIVLPQDNKIRIDSIDDELTNINNELANIIESDYTNWETGNIYNDGTDTALPERLRTDYIDINNLISFTSAGTINWRCFLYNANRQFLAYKGWYTSASNITKNNIITEYPLCEYVRFLVSSKDESPLSPDDINDLDIELLVYRIGTIESQIKLINSDLISKQEEIDALNADIFMPETDKYYYGKRINLNNNTFQITERIHPRGSGQACACFGNYVFAFNETTGKCNIFEQPDNISTPISTLDMPLVNNAIPHFNSAVFGDTVSGQDIPLLYTTVTTSTDLNCICAVYQFVKSSDTWSVSLVHTITIGFYDDDIWGTRSSYDMGTFFVHDNSLWVIGTSKTNNRSRFFELPMPDHTENVTITKLQIKSFFDTQYISCTQDIEYLNGILYITGGMGSSTYPTFIMAVNMYTQNVDSFIPLNLYWAHEIEFIYKYENNLWFGTINALKMDF